MTKLTPRTIALSIEYHLFKKEGALLRSLVPPAVQAALRRRARARYLLWESRKYNEWMQRHLQRRKLVYPDPVEPGLLSIMTPVWDGTPLNYLKALAESIIGQNDSGACEWVVLDNGCVKAALCAYLEALAKHNWVSVVKLRENVGIVRGLRTCLEQAHGRYVLPVDADDWLYPDCLQIVSAWIRRSVYPALLYTDEDKLIGSQTVQPYFKPDFDPVLLLNSAYIAHLGVIDRQKALDLDAYSDPSTEGSADWDLFIRFLVAGESALHIPEIVYSWRMHADSTADDAQSKPYIHSSQKAVLQRFLNVTGMAADYAVEYSPLLSGTADWWYQRKHNRPWPALVVELTRAADKTPSGAKQPMEYPRLKRALLPVESPAHKLAELGENHFANEDGLICLISRDIEIERADWISDALSLFERYPDAVMVGGRVRNRAGAIQSGGYVLGFDGDCGCPDCGRPAVDPGYFTQMLKQRSVSAVSSQFAVVRASFLRELYATGTLAQASIPFLGAWAGAHARRTSKRIIYSPFLSGISDQDWDTLVTAQERAAFRLENQDVLPDWRYYPRYFGLNRESAYQPVDPASPSNFIFINPRL